MPNYDVGRVVNMNAATQDHLNVGGRLELVILRNGKGVLDFLPSEAQIAEIKSKLEGK